MRAVPADTMVTSGAGREWGLDLNGEAYGPIVDGTVVAQATRTAFDGGAVADVPVVVGFTANEAELWTTFVPVNNQADLDFLLAAAALLYGWDEAGFQNLYDPSNFGNDLHEAYTAAASELLWTCPMRQQAELLGPHVDVRGYRWDRPLGLFPTLGAFHGVELPYVFGTGLLIGDELTASEQGIATWRSIAAGSPTIDGAPWPLLDPLGTPTWALLDVTPTTTTSLGSDARCDWMDAQGWPW